MCNTHTHNRLTNKISVNKYYFSASVCIFKRKQLDNEYKNSVTHINECVYFARNTIYFYGIKYFIVAFSCAHIRANGENTRNQLRNTHITHTIHNGVKYVPSSLPKFHTMGCSYHPPHVLL